MPTFKNQIDNSRIKTLSMDVLNQPNALGQLWDTLGLTKDEIEETNFWDLRLRLMQTGDEVQIRYHDPISDAIVNRGLTAVMAYAHLEKSGEYASKLFVLKPFSGEYFQLIAVKGVNAEAGNYAVVTTDPFNNFLPSIEGKFYAYLDAASTPTDIVVTVTDATGDTTYATGTIDAETATWGTSVELDVSTFSTASNSLRVNVETTKSNNKPINVILFCPLRRIWL
jgi:hypothetical protein